MSYITSRGHWYFISWKGNTAKSGGIATNIGVHFFDMLCWIFGEPTENTVLESNEDHAKGFLKLKQANVNWFLSVNSNHLPKEISKSGQRTFRSITINKEEIEFSGGFTDLHTRSYEEILKGKGFSLEDARRSIEIVHKIRDFKQA